MRKTISLLLAAAVTAGLFGACAAPQEKTEDPVPTAPPSMVLEGAEDRFEIAPSGYNWSWSEDDGRVNGVVADAIAPLDRAVLTLKENNLAPLSDKYRISFSPECRDLRFQRWDISDVGVFDAEPREQGDLTAVRTVVPVPGSVYAFRADFDNGSASYYAVTAPVTLSEYEAVEPETDSLEYLMSDEYSRWRQEYRQAAETSRAEAGPMYEWYAKALPVLLPGNDKNAVCSPLNIYLAAAALTELTDGQTRREMLGALNVPDTETLRRRVSALWAANDQDVPVFRSLLANSVWLRDGFAYREDTLRTLAEQYHAESFSGEMGSREFDEALRDWTNRNTHDLLREYADALHMDRQTVLALISTLYYKAAWMNEFRESLTSADIFRGVGGDEECEMMHRTAPMELFRGGDFSAVALSLSESGSMYFFLPDVGTAPESVLCGSDALSLIQDRHGYENRQFLTVELSVPVYTVSAKTDLKSALRALGISEIFDPARADFSALCDSDGVFLSTAEHAATVSVDEQGVTGAAYTAFAAMGAALPPEEIAVFRLDRPFGFAITGEDGSLLFAGVVNTLR
ncbi:MAG: serpin family protein [Oscillospiraceae bacterium]|nr:serpin family protein [Oscillospiraceae bacterium]